LLRKGQSLTGAAEAIPYGAFKGSKAQKMGTFAQIRKETANYVTDLNGGADETRTRDLLRDSSNNPEDRK